ncbi:signal transduction histidine kinase [Kibdelosporangium banguiense]|uniref:Signal transduction histidine kinase n=1 Tax=Kibdelosporangium banguiense TaxID=1365924 RepID=A0ABS4TWH7_9PSEU|nr:ATP-binding protein [Kibdelosporangium banguiense]MBP2328757.1 signal transduction histidine kinase [Kibdelosporangium banguiense]
MGLQGLTRLVAKPEVSKRITGFVKELDQTIGEIRRSILSLQEAPGGPASLRGELLRVIQEATSQLGFEPTLSIDGPVDSLVPDDVRPDVLATLRESLSNAARHADAHSVRITVAGTRLQLAVQDDGKGLPSRPPSRDGLADLSERAARWGGTCDIDSAPSRGTAITWTVPLVNA